MYIWTFQSDFCQGSYRNSYYYCISSFFHLYFDGMDVEHEITQDLVLI